ncbi:hypothetical protein KUCAC02_032311 [Chaenocephalus aceratus]|nr:hypothetical protein KUCAC02_032311 [Chaenocephalus aceratus]
MSLEKMSQPLLQLHSGCLGKGARPSLCRTRGGFPTAFFILANCGHIGSCGTSSCPSPHIPPDPDARPRLHPSADGVDALHLWKVRVFCPACRKQLTGGGVHRRSRKVLDIDRYYLMVTETLGCSVCVVNFLSTSQTVRDQLDLPHG